MKNYFKKFSIIFVMLLAIIGVGVIQDGNVANAATIGQQLVQPEDGWRRYDDTDSKIQYLPENYWGTATVTNLYNGSAHGTGLPSNNANIEAYANFRFKGTELRLIGWGYGGYPDNCKITIDGTVYNFSTKYGGTIYQCLEFEVTGLSDGVHSVRIDQGTDNSYQRLYIDAIDIDSTGSLLPYDYDKSISLDKSSIDLTVNDSQTLIAVTNPVGLVTTWKSSDESIAKYDSTTGKVIAVGEGSCTITATIDDGYNVSASCTVNVTTNPITSTIALNKTSDSLVAGETDNLVATTTPAGATVNWTSSDSSIATVDSTGKVTALKEGQTTITATTADGLTATCVVTVIPKTSEPTNPDPDPTDSEKIVNIAHAKGDNTNNAGGDVTIIFHGAADTTLSVVKTADVKDVWVGDNFTYTIVVTNTGTKTAKAVVVNDPAPNHIDFVVNGITTTQGTVDTSSTSKNIIVNVGEIAPGATVTIKVPATVIL
ncbi:Ig-like domain-containing protein [Clostridium sp. YIM B02569]|uniref:Ig-like domain-containing protein n=1 Tax=Clostridium sp. YIM B02569 TaxID=2911967 RepID=UPI001EE9E9BA|nr:Ig-like domain-containing protein [Clostridium sp. YIM B02569]